MLKQRLAKGLTMIDAKAAYLLGENPEYQRWLLFELARQFGRLLSERFGTRVKATIKIHDIPGIKGS